MHFVSLQKEENGKVMSTLPSAQNQFLQSGLGPGQEYEVSINIIKNNTRGPQTSKKVTTSECQSCRLDLTDEIIDVSHIHLLLISISAGISFSYSVWQLLLWKDVKNFDFTGAQRKEKNTLVSTSEIP